MEFCIERDRLLYLLDRAIKTVAVRDVKELFKNFVFRVEQDVLTVVSFDLEMGCCVQAKVRGVGEREIQGGCVGIPAEKLMGVVKSSSRGQDFEFRADDAGVSIKSGGACWTLTPRDIKRYPKTPGFKDSSRWVVPSTLLVAGLRATYRACSADDTRRGQVCVHLTTEGFFAIDGKRSYWKIAKLPVANPVMLHRNAVKFLVDVLPIDGDVEVSEDDFFVMFRHDQDLFYCLKTEDKPIDIYGSVFAPLPPETPGDLAMEVGRSSLIAGLSRVFVCSDSGTVTIQMDDADVPKVRLTAQDRNGDTAVDVVDGSRSWSGECKVNGEILLEALQLLRGDAVVIEAIKRPGKSVYRIKEGDFCAVLIAPRERDDGT